MKIYGYHLESKNNRAFIFEATIHEADEKPKTYKVTNDSRFDWLYTETLKKEDVGKLLGFSKDVLYLLEPNVELAKSIFKNKHEEKYQAALLEYNKAMAAINNSN